MGKTAVFPGSFDPFTIGHESIVQRALPLFDKIIIAIGMNAEKKALFSAADRKKWIDKLFEHIPNVSSITYESLTVELCKKYNAQYILRGLRTSVDFEYERAIAQNNKCLHPEIETVFMLTLPEHTHVNSTIIRDIIRHKGDASSFLPAIIAAEIKKSQP